MNVILPILNFITKTLICDEWSHHVIPTSTTSCVFMYSAYKDIIFLQYQWIAIVMRIKKIMSNIPWFVKGYDNTTIVN